MDYHKLQQTLFALDPSDRSEDLRKLAAQAQGNAAADASPTKDYITESVDVPDGSMPLDIDSVSDFAKLAGVTLNEASKWDAFKHGMKNYNKLDALNVSLDDKDKDKDIKASPNAKQTQPNSASPKQSAAPKSEFPQGEINGKMYQIKPGDQIGYVNKKGQSKVGEVTVMLDTYDSKKRKQIQLKIGNTAVFAISRDSIKTVNSQPFTLKDTEAGSGTIEALEARVAYLESVIETLLEGKKVPSLKPRDPNAQYMTDLRKSGAMGAHKDKKKDAKAGKMKHKGKEFESIKEHLLRKLNSK